MKLTILDYQPGADQITGIEYALELAEFSDCLKRHGAVVMKGSKVLGRGFNKTRNKPSVLSPEHVLTGASIHAEVAAIRDAGDCHGAAIYVARIGAKGSPLLSRPCARCYAEIARVGIRKIIHT